MFTKIVIREETAHMIRMDLSISAALFDVILVCTSEDFCGRNWYLVLPNWNLSCRVGEYEFYNKNYIGEILEKKTRYAKTYTPIMAKIIADILCKHDKDINNTVYKNLLPNNQ